MTKQEFVAVRNSESDEEPLKIVDKLEKAVKLALKYRTLPRCSHYLEDRDASIELPDAVARIFVPKLVLDKKRRILWKDGERELPKRGKYYFIVDGLGYYPGNDYPVIKPDGWFLYTDIVPFNSLDDLMACHRDEEGCYSYGSRVWDKKKSRHMYAQEVFRLDDRAGKKGK